MDNCNTLVFVQCSTYNQSQYIKDALDGFVMQKTNFPFVCCVVDDASTDGEQAVINSYCEEFFDCREKNVYQYDETDDYIRFFVRHKTNRNCFFLVINLKYNHYSIQKAKMPYYMTWRNDAKYLAICEGDDYWTDPLKLQKQVDFMETHPEHSLCYCNNIRLFSDGHQEMQPRYPSSKEICPIEDLISEGGGAISTHTMFFRQELYVPYSTWAKGCPVGDLPMMLSLAAKGYVGFLSDVMGVHRFEAKGSWTSKMATDRNKTKKVSRAIIKMYRQFDEWTNYKYHTAVRKKIRDIRTTVLKGDIVFYIRKLFR
jgi:glycosyltransferase involved in cell wall biosynthesis